MRPPGLLKVDERQAVNVEENPLQRGRRGGAVVHRDDVGDIVAGKNRAFHRRRDAVHVVAFDFRPVEGYIEALGNGEVGFVYGVVYRLAVHLFGVDIAYPVGVFRRRADFVVAAEIRSGRLSGQGLRAVVSAVSAAFISGAVVSAEGASPEPQARGIAINAARSVDDSLIACVS